MSLLSRKYYRLGLGASYVLLAEVHGRHIKSLRMKTWENTTKDGWQPALQTASSWIHEIPSQGLSIDVFLSAELVQLQLLPWRDDATSVDQQSLLVKARLQDIYGENAHDHLIRMEATGYGQPWLSASVERDLLDSIIDEFKAVGVKTLEIQPLSISLFNSVRNSLRGPANWLLVIENKLVTAMHLRNDQWQVVQTLPISYLEFESLKDLLQRETTLAGLNNEPCGYHIFGDAGHDKTKFDALDPAWNFQGQTPGRKLLHLIGAAK